MNKELQDLAWACVPKAFRDAVRQKVEYYNNPARRNRGYYRCLVDFFGLHNLTSDAEGEEMLMVPRKDIVKIFAGQTEVQKNLSVESIGHHVAAAQTEVLYNLFGSKCLPDSTSSKNQ